VTRAKLRKARTHFNLINSRHLRFIFQMDSRPRLFIHRAQFLRSSILYKRQLITRLIRKVVGAVSSANTCLYEIIFHRSSPEVLLMNRSQSVIIIQINKISGRFLILAAPGLTNHSTEAICRMGY
jgi:hypothetical protein